LTKHILEKKIQEQERQIQRHFSSRDDYLSKMTELETKCSALFKIAEDTNEHIERLQANGRFEGGGAGLHKVLRMERWCEWNLQMRYPNRRGQFHNLGCP
jgi:DNA repair exonuclease SbcCD ATPase subunit